MSSSAKLSNFGFAPKEAEKLATTFKDLSQLVLIDILSALPMRRVMFIMWLNNPRFRFLCSRPWVLKRMTGVSFPLAVKAYREGGNVRSSFSSDVVLRRLNGEVLF